MPGVSYDNIEVKNIKFAVIFLNVFLKNIFAAKLAFLENGTTNGG